MRELADQILSGKGVQSPVNRDEIISEYMAPISEDVLDIVIHPAHEG
jgi:hypothetical protein